MSFGKQFFESKRVLVVITSILIAVIVGCGITVGVVLTSYEQASAANSTQISKLQSGLDADKQKDTPTSTSTLSEAGMKIADVQTQYSQLNTVNDNNDAIKDADKGIVEYDSKGDFRLPWFVPTSGSITWSFVSTSTAYNEYDDVDSMWVAKDKDGTIVAFVTGVYHVQTKTFDSFNLIVTSAGKKLDSSQTAKAKSVVSAAIGVGNNA